jgi:hypothetical protein
MSNSMPLDLKNKWVTALRSGEYQQGTGKMYNEETNTYCCLGVLEHIVNGWVSNGRGLLTHKFCDVNNIDFDYKGEELCSPSFDIPQLKSRPVSAHSLNDIHRWTFEQIADVIEQQVEGV